MEKSLKGYLQLGVKTVVFEKTVVERQWKYGLSWSSDKLTACFLVLDSPQNLQEVNEHHAVGELSILFFYFWVEVRETLIENQILQAL